jgi:hypothetical protein
MGYAEYGAYYWEIRDAELDPTGKPIRVVGFGRSPEEIIVGAVKLAGLLKKTLVNSALTTSRVAELVEHYLCTIPPTKVAEGDAFVLFHVVSGSDNFVFSDPARSRIHGKRRGE